MLDPDTIAQLNMLRCVPVGSRVTCDEWAIDSKSDYDYLVLVRDLYLLNEAAEKLGFVNESKENAKTYDDGSSQPGNSSPFRSFRKDEVNLIATQDETFFKRFLAATSVAKRLKINVKDDRIALFQACLYGKGDLK